MQPDEVRWCHRVCIITVIVNIVILRCPTLVVWSSYPHYRAYFDDYRDNIVNRNYCSQDKRELFVSSCVSLHGNLSCFLPIAWARLSPVRFNKPSPVQTLDLKGSSHPCLFSFLCFEYPICQTSDWHSASHEKGHDLKPDVWRKQKINHNSIPILNYPSDLGPTHWQTRLYEIPLCRLSL